MTAKTAGRTSRRFKQLKAQVRMRRRGCCLCGQPIDYSLEWPDPRSFSVQHIKSWDDHPELREEPTNLDAAHLGCNSSQGKRAEKPSLGASSEVW